MTEFRNPVDGNVLNVRIEGPEDAPNVLLAHSIGCDLRLWDAQAEALKAHYRIIRYDARGHGSSSATEGAYSIEQLASDAIAILDQLGIDAVHLCGLSLGGTLGMWMAINAPERLKSVTLADTAARLGTIEGWQSRIDVVAESGTESIADLSMPRFFSEAYIERAPEVIAHFRQQLVDTADAGFAGCAAVLRDCDFREQLDQINTPTLVICGKDDFPTPPHDSEFLAVNIKGAKLVLLDAGHISAVEQPEAFTQALDAHIRSIEG